MEYGAWRAISIETGATLSVLSEAVKTVPAERYYDVELEGVYENGPPTAQDLESRIATWYTRRSGLITGTLAGLRFAGLGPGDVVRVTHSGFRQADGSPFSTVRCVVLSAVASLDDAVVAVTLAVPGLA